MAQNITIPIWLPLLRQLFPPTGIILVGAGSGHGHWVPLLSAWDAANVLLVEADESQCQHLSAVVQAEDNWQLSQQLVAAKEGDAAFYRANNSAENGLLDPQLLRNIWPNIDIRDETVLPATTLAALQDDYALHANWLLVDCLPGVPILSGAGDTLAQFDVVVVRMLLKDDVLDESLAHQRTLDHFMVEQGFRCLVVEPERHPALGHGLYVRDFPSVAQQQFEQNQQLENDLLAVEKNAADTAVQLETVTRVKLDKEKQAEELKSQVVNLEQVKTELEKVAAEQKQQLAQKNKLADEQNSRIRDLTEQLAQAVQLQEEQTRLAAERQTKIAQLTQARNEQAELVVESQSQLQSLAKSEAEQKKMNKEQRSEIEKLKITLLEAKKHSAELETQLSEMEVRQKMLSEKLIKADEQTKTQNNELAVQVQKHQTELVSTRKALEKLLKSETLNATKQIEAFLGVQNYFHTGELIGNMHGWPISPDFALYLIELLETNDYDLIIEFGSGVSTVIMAKTLAKIASHRQGKRKTEQIAFEHLERYHADTSAKLKQAGLAEAVQVVLAPLQPYTAPNGNIYSYYSCNDTLAAYAKRPQSEGLRILIVVDGPPASTGKNARYPALPIVISHYVDAHVDLVLDDYRRDDEKEIAQFWLADVQSTGQQANITEIKLEKEACLLSFEPRSQTTP